MGPLAVAASAVLVLFLWRPDLPVSLLILFASGVFAAYQLAANAAFVNAAPQEQRSQAFGLAQGGMSLGQGTVMILAGAVADHHHSAASVIAVCGAVGAVVALAIAFSWARDRGHSDRHGQRSALAPAVAAHRGLLSAWLGVGWAGGLAPAVAAHGALLSLRARKNSLSNQLNAWAAAAVQPSSRRTRLTPFRMPARGQTRGNPLSLAIAS
jgi:hypothetical protein